MYLSKDKMSKGTQIPTSLKVLSTRQSIMTKPSNL